VAHCIERRAEQMGLSESINRLIDGLDQQILQDPASVYAVIETILIRQWPPLDRELALKWIRAGCCEGIRRGHYAEWATILKECSAYDMKLQYAVCLRRLSEWQAAENLLEDLVRLTGQGGEFDLQGRALTQLAILYRQRGYYEKAINLLDRARLNAELTTDQKLVAELEREYAKIELDSGQWQGALARLGNVTEHSDADTLSLMGEALMAAGHYGQALECLEAAIHESQDNALVLGRLYAAKGRLYADQGEVERAEEDLTAAIVILEQQSDWFALARAKSVLAAALITSGHDLEDAAGLLRHAQDIQTEIMDRAGLVFTRRNLRELDRLSLTPNKKRLQS
jgi:tetratricopeptide (TPR) repeat protein